MSTSNLRETSRLPQHLGVSEESLPPQIPVSFRRGDQNQVRTGVDAGQSSVKSGTDGKVSGSGTREPLPPPHPE